MVNGNVKLTVDGRNWGRKRIVREIEEGLWWSAMWLSRFEEAFILRWSFGGAIF